jgi:hypothetical protein
MIRQFPSLRYTYRKPTCFVSQSTIILKKVIKDTKKIKYTISGLIEVNQVQKKYTLVKANRLVLKLNYNLTHNSRLFLQSN